MAQNTGFYMTLPSDGSISTFPENTVAHFKTLLTQTMDFTDGEWEVGLTEMMYPNTLQNIDPKEAHFDILIPTHLDVEPEDPDIYRAGRFTIEKIGREKLIECPMLVDWDEGFWKISIDRNSEANHYRVKFRGGPYPDPQSLIEEINEGLRRCLEKVWKQIPDEETGDVGNMKLEYRQKVSRIEFQLNGKELSTLRFSISLPLTLGYN